MCPTQNNLVILVYITCFFLFIHNFDSEDYLCIMVKTKKIKQCYRSASGSRRPQCNQAPVGMCSPCSEAMAYYNHTNAFSQTARRQSNRISARLSRMKKEDNFRTFFQTTSAKVQEIFAILLAELT